MKLIKPMGGIEAATTSDAPNDNVQQWEPVGRDFVTEISEPIVGCGNNIMVICEANPDGVAWLTKVDLSTGIVERDVVQTPFIRVASVLVSPDDAWVAVSGTRSGGGALGGDSNVLRVYSTSLFDIKYSSGVFGNHRMKWLPDSSGLVYISATDDLNYGNSRYMEVGLVSAGTWTKTSGADFQTVASNGSSNGVFRTSELAVNDTSTAVLFGLVSGTFTTGDTEYDQFIVKVDLPSFTYSTNYVGQINYTRTLGFCAHNSYRNEIIIGVYSGTTRSVKAFDDSSLAEKTMSITDPGNVWGVLPSPDTDELILRSLTTSPKYRRVVASTYADDTNLDGIQNQDTVEVAYSGDYYVFANSGGGYSLVQRSDDSLVTQTNPNVAEGDTYVYNQTIYQALSDNNDRPDIGAAGYLDGTGKTVYTWENQGKVNPLRMFDGKLNSTTAANDSLNIEITPGKLSNGLALFNVTSATVQVTMTDPDAGMIYDTGAVKMKDNSGVLGWHDYFFSPRPAKRDLALTDIPTYPNATINITLSAPGSEVAIGGIVLGRVQTIAQTQYGTSVGIIDSSRKERDQFGNFSILERPFSKRAEYDLWLPRAATSGVQRILAGYRASPIVYIGNIEEEALIVYGFYRDFQINYENFSISAATITVEGL